MRNDAIDGCVANRQELGASPEQIGICNPAVCQSEFRQTQVDAEPSRARCIGFEKGEEQAAAAAKVKDGIALADGGGKALVARPSVGVSGVDENTARIGVAGMPRL